MIQIQKIKNKCISKVKEIKSDFDVLKRSATMHDFLGSLARDVAPSIIEEYTSHLVINYEILAKCIVVGVPHKNVDGYPRDINPRFVDELLSLSTENYIIGYSFAAIPIGMSESMKMLDNALFYNRVNQISYTEHNAGNSSLKLDLDRDDFVSNYKLLHDNSQKMLHTAFIIIIWAHGMKEMREAESKIRTILEANRVRYEFPYCRMLDTFLAAQPYPTSANYCWTELFSKYAAVLSQTRNQNSNLSNEGLYVGIDIKTGKHVMLDLRALAAQHLMITGMTGSGKSFSLLMLLMRAFDMLGKRIIYTTPKADITTSFTNVAEWYGDIASTINIGPKGKNLNPLEILYDKNLSDLSIQVFDNQMELLIKFYRLLFEGSQTINMTSYLNESLLEAYRRKGIIRESPETWKNEAPTMLDLRNIWKEDSKNEDLGSKARTAEALVEKSFMIETTWSYINRPTDINLSADFIVIDLSGVPDSLREAMNVLVTGIIGLRFSTDTKKETIIAVDEASVFLRNPSLCLFLLKLLTQGRSFNISLWLATQQTGDLIKAGVDEEFKTNISVSIVMGNMRKDAIDHVKHFYKLNKNDTEILETMGVGEGLIIVGNEIIPAKFEPSEHEKSIIKGKTEKISKEELAIINDIGVKLVNPKLAKLVVDHGIIFKDWVDGDDDILAHYGYESTLQYRTVGQGTLNAWIKKDIIQGEHVYNQLPMHYCSVLQLAGYLVLQGFEVIVNHFDDVDIIAKYKGKIITFEIEMKNSHNKQQLIDKRQFALDKYGKVIFVASTESKKSLLEALGGNYILNRGNDLITYIENFKSEAFNDVTIIEEAAEIG